MRKILISATLVIGNLTLLTIALGCAGPNSSLQNNADISEIKDDSGLLAYCVESKVVSRSGPFRIRVLLDKQLCIKQATVISYPADRGRDICKPAFTDQFNGKGSDDPIQIGKDIDAMTGATISSHAMAKGVRDTIKLLKRVKEKQLKSKLACQQAKTNNTNIQHYKKIH